MANTPTQNKWLLEPTAGDPNWDVPLNANLTVIDQAFGSTFPISVGTGGTQNLTSSTPASSSVYWWTAQQLTVTATGALSSNAVITFPSSINTAGTLRGSWIVSNNISAANQGAYTLTVKGASGSGVTIAAGKTAQVFFDGTDVFYNSTMGAKQIYQTVTTTSTVSDDILGGTLVLGSTLASSITVTIPSPVGNEGRTITVYSNASAYTATLSTPSGTFSGYSGSAASTMGLQRTGYNAYYFLVSNGTNWIVFAPLVAKTPGGALEPRVSSTTSTATLSWNSDNYDQYVITAQAASLAISADSAGASATDGRKIVFRILDNGTARAITWSSATYGFRAVGVTLPTTTTASKTTYVGAIYNESATKWDVVAVNTQA